MPNEHARVGTLFFGLMKALLYSVILVCVTFTAYAGGAPVKLDITQFRFDSSRTTLHLCYAFADTALAYHREGKSLGGGLKFKLSLSSNISSVVHEEWSVEHKLSMSRDSNGRELAACKDVVCSPGQYTLKIVWTDFNRPQRRDSLTQSIVVRSLSTSKTLCSDLMLSTLIANADAPTSNGLYKRNGFAFVPNPTSEYRGSEPVVRSYFELYNLKSLNTDSIVVLYSVLDGAQRPVFDSRFERKVVANSQTEVFEQSLEVLPSGVYSLNVIVHKPGATELDSIRLRKKFYLLNPNIPAELSDLRAEDDLFLASEFAAMPESRINEEYEKAKAVGPESALLSFNQLTTLLAKQKFLFRYWLMQDPDPTTIENERYEKFKKAVDYAIKNYKNAFHPRGWDCDQGRILMKYGFPTNIAREYFNWDGARPHETWSYDEIQGGVIFVFVDAKGSGAFRLVHSTAINEHRDDDWYKRYALDHENR